MNCFRKMLASMLLFVVGFVSISENTYAVEVNRTLDNIVYVDGVAFRVETDFETGIVSVLPLLDRNIVLEVFPDGHGEAVAYSQESGSIEEYELEIMDLSADKVDIDVLDKSGDYIDSIDSVEELMSDSYEGQEAVTVLVGISLETLITALIEIAACILVAGIIYYAGKAVVAELSREKSNKDYYFKAYIMDHNVFINLSNRLSRQSAIACIRSGNNIYTMLRDNAKSITLATGLGCEGPEISCLSGGKVMFYHYHVGHRINKAHIFYGSAVIGK